MGNQFHPFSLLLSHLDLSMLANVLKTEPVTESEELPVHDSLVGQVVESRLNR